MKCYLVLFETEERKLSTSSLLAVCVLFTERPGPYSLFRNSYDMWLRSRCGGNLDEAQISSHLVALSGFLDYAMLNSPAIGNMYDFCDEAFCDYQLMFNFLEDMKLQAKVCSRRDYPLSCRPRVCRVNMSSKLICEEARIIIPGEFANSRHSRLYCSNFLLSNEIHNYSKKGVHSVQLAPAITRGILVMYPPHIAGSTMKLTEEVP